MTTAAATLVRRATAIVVWLSFGVLVTMSSGAGAGSLQGPTATSSQLRAPAAHTEWGFVPAARNALGQHDTDPAPRDATGAVAVLGGMLICLALRSARAGGAVAATAVRSEVSRGRTCRAPPLPQPL